MSKKKEYQKVVESTTTSVVNDDGEHLQSEHTKRFFVPVEPSYVKVYLADIMYLKALPKWSNQILYNLLKIMNYENKIFLNAELKKEMAADLDINVQTINDALTKFTKSKILIRFGSSSYIANPNLFGKGEWKNIRKIRLNVEYDFDLETKEITSIIDKDEETIEQQLNQNGEIV